MPDIVLSTLNAKFIHAAFGLRYLRANLGPLRPLSELAEFDINQRPLDIVEGLLARNPKIIGLGVYIWNVGPTTEVVALLKRVRPAVTIILGGPEVSFETEAQPITALADYIITGEADLKFREICAGILAGEPPRQKIIPSGLPHFAELVLPYDEYEERDIAHRILYVEASRGCPFTCEFCLSSLEVPVRQAPLDALLKAFERLLERNAKQFKFVDRTFNLNPTVSRGILDFFLERYRPGLFLHFEMVPDRLPEGLRETILRFPAGALQFEVGVQTFNPEVAARIQRRQNYARLEDNLTFLRSQTGVHIHADLIAGLPGESLESFATGFDRLVQLQPQEIQVGILKRLRGTPISRHDAEWEMLYGAQAPYEILRNNLMSFETMQKLRRFARYWDLVGNSGNFLTTTPLLWRAPTAGEAGSVSPFQAFMNWSEWLYSQTGRTDGISLLRLMELLFRYLTSARQYPSAEVACCLWRDYQRGGHYDKPTFLRAFLPTETAARATPQRPLGPKRQSRHWLGPGMSKPCNQEKPS